MYRCILVLYSMHRYFPLSDYGPLDYPYPLVRSVCVIPFHFHFSSHSLSSPFSFFFHSHTSPFSFFFFHSLNSPFSFFFHSLTSPFSFSPLYTYSLPFSLSPITSSFSSSLSCLYFSLLISQSFHSLFTPMLCLFCSTSPTFSFLFFPPLPFPLPKPLYSLFSLICLSLPIH